MSTNDPQQQRRAIATRGRTLSLTTAVLTGDEQHVRAIMADLAADPDGGAASAAVILDLAGELGQLLTAVTGSQPAAVEHLDLSLAELGVQAAEDDPA
ncbi:hypothetical protein [Kocuria sp. SM24M-10]|uniref:hypothetical protein n=1 Tax=Kocuria sp. SM24M-10 TaxID=1660349 RepID=UPI00064B212B|nr:hypothetical protein [Kocuria sp. SM24M-10]KLU08091.1 hypothetical protein ABL57_19870 [Kocuria sp. SM24M-10]